MHPTWKMEPNKEPPAWLSTEPFQLERGVRIDQYEILRPVGAGGNGEVYVARDMILGRRVALKLGFEGADSKDMGQAEARAMAEFNHPNIVTVYGVGSYESRPYIAMEYVEGETLRQRLDGGLLTLAEAQRFGLTIAQALQQAHAHGVLHADLKPDNIIIGRDGRMRVLDFGLAQRITQKDSHHGAAGHEALSELDDVLPGDGDAIEHAVAPPKGKINSGSVRVTSKVEPVNDQQSDSEMAFGSTVIRGTPLFIAPEIWLGQENTSAIDMWAFGIVLFELLTGSYPFQGLSGDNVFALGRSIIMDEPIRVDHLRPVPDELGRLVASCLIKDPKARATAADAVAVLFRLVHGLAAESAASETSPFRGLSAFTEEHAAFFFGRDDEAAQFIERMRGEVVLPVIGASGVGKSSFVQAGIIPRLKEKGEWRVVRLRPSAQPFLVLAERFSVSRTTGPNNAAKDAGGVEELAQELYDNPKKLALMLQQLARDSRASVLLLVDQLEEVCTLVSSDETRLRFLSAICQAADDPDDSVRVIFTARDDFLTRLAESPEARQALTQVSVLRTPGKEALRDILEKPLIGLGHRYDDPTLVDDMLAAVANETAALPLLQFCGSMLWERRDQSTKQLLRGAYTALGGVQGALATHANEFMRELTDKQSGLVRAVMLRLVTPEGTRRVVAKAKLLEALGEGAEDVLLRLTNSRLLSTREILSEVSVELSHESLVHTWNRLVQWLEEGREELVFLAELDQAAELWHRRGRKNREVWTGPALIDAERNLDRFAARLNLLANDFIQAGRRAERTRRRLRRAIIAAGVVALVTIAVVSTVTSIRFAEKTRIAIKQTELAEVSSKQSHRDLATALVEKAVSAERDLHWAEAATYLAAARVEEADPLPHWRADELEHADLVPLSRFEVGADVIVASLSPDRQYLATNSGNGWVKLWRTADGKLLCRIPAPSPSFIARLRFALNGNLAVGQTTGQIELFNATCERVASMSIPEGPNALNFSPTGDRLVVGAADGTLLLFDPAAHRLLHTWSSHQGTVNDLDFSPDGKMLATAGQDHTLRLWDLQANVPRMKRTLTGGSDYLFDVAFAPNGAWLASAANEGTLALWDARHPSPGHTIGYPHSAFNGISFAPGGEALSLATATMEGMHGDLHILATPQLTDLANRAVEAPVTTFWGPTDVFVIGRYAERLTIRLPSGAESTAPSGDLSHAPGSTVLVRTKNNGTIEVDPEGQKPVLVRAKSQVTFTKISDNGEWLASYDPSEPLIRLWPLSRPGPPSVIDGFPLYAVQRIGLSPDGHFLGALIGQTIKVYDGPSQKLEAEIHSPLGYSVDLLFSSSADTLAILDQAGKLLLWQWQANRELPLPAPFAKHLLAFSYSPDGRFALGQGEDGTIHVVTMADNQEVGRLVAHRARVGDWSYFGHELATTGQDGTVRLWNLDHFASNAVVDGDFADATMAMFAQDGHELLVGKRDGSLGHFRPEPAEDPKQRLERYLQKYKLRLDGVDLVDDPVKW